MFQSSKQSVAFGFSNYLLTHVKEINFDSTDRAGLVQVGASDGKCGIENFGFQDEDNFFASRTNVSMPRITLIHGISKLIN
jgi:hypothetical protein